jgi:hypothetical protein
METASCLGFNIACDVLLKGGGVVLAGFILFVGSVYVLLSALFGRWMAYLVVIVAFSGWMIIQSSIWLFGFWSLGPGTPVNLGPRGREASWVVNAAGLTPQNTDVSDTYTDYPQDPWSTVPPDHYAESEPSAINGAATAYLAEITNEELGRGEFDFNAVTAAQFTVDHLATATAGDGTDIAVVTAHYNGGGPVTVMSLAYDEGAVSSWSWLFLILSLLVFAIHLPLLDRAERSRKEFLTGGSAPPWYGPA